jgi:hypothetical protein
VIPLAVLFTWRFLNTKGSLFIAVLFHAWYDLVLQYFGAMVLTSDYERMWWLLFATQGMAATTVLMAQHRRSENRPPASVEAQPA